MRNNRNKISLFSQTKKHIEILHRDVGPYDMYYNEFQKNMRKFLER